MIALAKETINEDAPLLLFDPTATWKKMILEPGTFTLKELLLPIFINGNCVYESPSVLEVQKHCKQDLDTLWPESKRLTNPQEVYVDLTTNLYNLKQSMIEQFRESRFS